MTGQERDLDRHLVDDVLTWWLEHGIDEESGGVLACWSNDGSQLVSTDKFTWTQGRWAWLTSAVALMGRDGILDVDADHYARLAAETATFVADHAILEDATTVFVTTRDGEPKEPTPGSGLHTSVFADLFAALGFAGAARLDGNTAFQELALRLLLSAEERIIARQAKSDPYPVPDGHLSLALPMILVGAGEQVHRATGSPEAQRIVTSAVRSIVDDHLLGADVAEMPLIDPGASSNLLSRHRVPGHVLELVWFLDHARDLVGDEAPDRSLLAEIALHALRVGWDDEHGGLLRFVDEEGGEPRGVATDHPYEAMVRDTWDTKLWWPHAEAIYTTRLLEDQAPELTDWRERIEAWTLETFPDGPGREWTQIRTRDGSALDKVVALPLKDPMHIARSLALRVALDKRGHPWR